MGVRVRDDQGHGLLAWRGPEGNGKKTVKVNRGPKDQSIPLCIPYKTKD